ncbi:response regulator [Aquimarina spongiae]|uniref:Response regulator receiver domain-containing protein n=1 Tax=Aquimarina spongiae TaxID=570521 RepID=A0A1M6GEV4_9FLAO|nr:response regulator [Aquimarina spongiae]SHJ08411.1 Response regulator receiver domain-containing protein [Aquimarina spongiae]
MMGKLKQVLLVDDSKATNFFNKTIIEKLNCAEEVVTVQNGEEALKWIQSNSIHPELIFLDINMPVMDGWEFLSEYQKLEDKDEKAVIVLMIGAALSKEELIKANSISEIKEFSEKMLSKITVGKIINQYFNDIDIESNSSENNRVL